MTSAAMIDVNTVFGFWPGRKADIALPTLLRLLREARIARAFTLSARGIFYDFVGGNRETREACESHPELLPAATVNPCRWIDCLEEARRMVDRGIRLFRFFPQHQEWHIGQAHFGKLLDDVFANSDAALMIPASEGVTAIGDLARRLNNPVIIQAIRYDRLAEAIVVMDQSPNVYLETHLVNSPDFVELLSAEVGEGRLLFGSNAPLAYVGAALAPIQLADVSDDRKELILGGTAARLLGVST